MEEKILYKGGTAEIVEKKSRFIGQLFAVKSEEEALTIIEQVRKQYYDARHNCFAYRIGDEPVCKRSSDDGEPSGTAGRPMLDVLEGEGLTDVLAIVTRYFGGTLLGTGGLVRAYSGALKEALAQCELVTQYQGHKIQVKMDYNAVGKLQYLFATYDIKELETMYGADACMILLVPTQRIEQFHNQVTEITSGKAQWEDLGAVRYGQVNGQVIIL